MGGAVVLLFTALLTSASCQNIVFQVVPEDVTAAVGTSVRFDCSFTSSVPVTLSWLHDGATIVSESRHTYHANGSLQIDPTIESDAGDYTCRVSEQLSQNFEDRTAELTLLSLDGSFLVSPDPTTVDEGDSLVLFCLFNGSVAIFWAQDGSQVESSEECLSVLFC